VNNVIGFLPAGKVYILDSCGFPSLEKYRFSYFAEAENPAMVLIVAEQIPRGPMTVIPDTLIYDLLSHMLPRVGRNGA
jgi:hypothetical protein